MYKPSSSSSQMNSVLSNLSLDTIEDEEIEPWHGLIHKLSAFHLDNLNAIFKEQKYKDGVSLRNPKSEKGLSKEEFVNAIDEVFGLLTNLIWVHKKQHGPNQEVWFGLKQEIDNSPSNTRLILGNCKYSLQATILFSQIDKEDNHKITWNQFLDFVIEDAETKLDQSVQLSIGEIFTPPHVKRETISKIVPIETQRHFCYAILSKYGRVGLYDGNMNFLTSYYTIMSREDITRKDAERRRRNRWITDAIFLENVQMFIVTTSARSITIYDASGLKHVPLWLIMGIPNVIQCFSYHSNGDVKNNALFMGDDHGQILSLQFLQPKNGLLRKKHNDKLNLFYWVELQNEKEFLIIKNYGKLHKENVKVIQFFSDNHTVVSCSRDTNASVVIRHPENRRKSYIFKMKRGASCFSISRLLKVLVTGSDDGIVRLWNTVATEKPIAVLKSHQCGVIDVQIMELNEVFLSCSRDGILKLWTIKDQKCIQTVNIKFPAFQVLGKTIEWGTDTIYPGPKRHPFKENVITQSDDAQNNEPNITEPNFELPKSTWERSHIFVTCCNYMARINLTFKEIFEENLQTPVLPPPPLQNSVLIPTNWKIGDDNVDLRRTSDIKIDDEQISKHLESLKFILEKDLLAEDNLYSNINYCIATLETKKLQMQESVSRCAPYLALDLQEPQEIKLSPNLPVPNSKRIRNLVDKTHRMLSAASARSQIFSEASTSSRTRSSRSSIISFD